MSPYLGKSSATVVDLIDVHPQHREDQRWNPHHEGEEAEDSLEVGAGLNLSSAGKRVECRVELLAAGTDGEALLDLVPELGLAARIECRPEGSAGDEHSMSMTQRAQLTQPPADRPAPLPARTRLGLHPGVLDLAQHLLHPDALPQGEDHPEQILRVELFQELPFEVSGPARRIDHEPDDPRGDEPTVVIREGPDAGQLRPPPQLLGERRPRGQVSGVRLAIVCGPRVVGREQHRRSGVVRSR